MVNLQVFVLSLIPLLSGAVPGDGHMSMGVPALLGMCEPISKEFMVGTWKYSDEFFRWGVTDKGKAAIKPFRGRAFMSLAQDGTVKMVNLFRPSEGKWAVSDEGLVLFDPKLPEHVMQTLPVRKRDNNRIWVLFPFSGGASGIGMVRVPDEEFSQVVPSAGTQASTKRKKTKEIELWEPTEPVRSPGTEDSIKLDLDF